MYSYYPQTSPEAGRLSDTSGDYFYTGGEYKLGSHCSEAVLLCDQTTIAPESKQHWFALRPLLLPSPTTTALIVYFRHLSPSALLQLFSLSVHRTFLPSQVRTMTLFVQGSRIKHSFDNIRPLVCMILINYICY